MQTYDYIIGEFHIHCFLSGPEQSCVLAINASREREGSLDDPIQDELDFTKEMHKQGFKATRRWVQPLNVPAEE